MTARSWSGLGGNGDRRYSGFGGEGRGRESRRVCLAASGRAPKDRSRQICSRNRTCIMYDGIRQLSIQIGRSVAVSLMRKAALGH